MAALSREEDEKKQMVTAKIEAITRDISALAELIQSVKREMGAEDLTFLLVHFPYFCFIYFFK